MSLNDTPTGNPDELEGAATPPNWESEYANLVSGIKSLEAFTPADLFEMGQYFVLKGDFATRNTIYETYIINHPEASEDDKMRVSILQADMKRRQGKEKTPEALKDLEILRPTGDIVRAELLEAQKQCHILLGNGADALRLGRETIALCDSPEIPLDKRIFYHSGNIATALGFEPEVSEDTLAAMRQYRALLDDPSLQGDRKAYASQEYSHLRGKIAEKMGDMETAKEGYKGQYELAIASGIKAVAALLYLFIAWNQNPEDRNLETMQMASYLRAHNVEIQPAWRQVYQEKNDLVQGILAKLYIGE